MKNTTAWLPEIPCMLILQVVFNIPLYRLARRSKWQPLRWGDGSRRYCPHKNRAQNRHTIYVILRESAVALAKLLMALI